MGWTVSLSKLQRSDHFELQPHAAIAVLPEVGHPRFERDPAIELARYRRIVPARNGSSNWTGPGESAGITILSPVAINALGER